MSSRLSEVEAALRGFRGVLRRNVSLAPYTHVRIGGPAAWFAEPMHESDVSLLVATCRELAVPCLVIGGGSNLLISDSGVEAVVVSLDKLNRIVRDKNRITAGAGVSLPSLLRSAREIGLAGLEVLTGIPAVVGGAVAMNAGTRDGETFAHLASVVAVDADGEIRVLDRTALAPRYRDGGLKDRIVLQATFELTPDDPRLIQARFEESLRRRNATQPVTQRSVGCVFQNPPGDAAGHLIDSAGLKLTRRGGISVSAKHANYFINEGEGTCRDFLELIDVVQAKVQERFGVHLDLEVKRWG